jgi:predicted nucleic-acid-binding Zn-ribbon protein
MDSHAQPSSFPPCPECGGRRIGTRAGAHVALVRQGETFEHLISGFRALVCTACGYTNFYADNLQKLNQEMKQHPDDFEL